MNKKNWALTKSVISFVKYQLTKNKIPKDPKKIKEMLHRLEQEEKQYQEKIRNIKKIKQLQRDRKNRNKEPDKRSIFKKCKVCHEKYLKSERHEC